MCAGIGPLKGQSNIDLIHLGAVPLTVTVPAYCNSPVVRREWGTTVPSLVLCGSCYCRGDLPTIYPKLKDQMNHKIWAIRQILL